jgi:hypothetical protein
MPAQISEGAAAALGRENGRNYILARKIVLVAVLILLLFISSPRISLEPRVPRRALRRR